jgi:hypothetical protein
VPWPNAFVVYSVVALIAEVLHVVPLALLTLPLGLRCEGDAGAVAIECVVVVALVETGYQVTASRGARAALVVFVGADLTVIGATQMLLPWRFGVGAMFVFRLAHDTRWHIVRDRLRRAGDR